MSNPYAAAQAELRKAMYIETGPEFGIIINFLYAIQVLWIIVNTSTLLLRWKSGKLWIFRSHATPEGWCIVPNPVVSWLLWSIVFYSLALYHTYRTRQSGKEGTDLTNYIYWMGTIWLPLWIASWSWAWSTGLAPFVSNKTSYSGKSSSSPWIRISPTVVTFFYIITPFACISVILVQCGIANHHFNALFNLFRQLDASLTGASEALDAGLLDLLPSAAEMAAGQDGFQATFDTFTNLFIDMWIGWICVDGLFFTAMVIAVWAQWRDLKGAIDNIKLSESIPGSEQRSRKLSSLAWSLRSLKISSAMVIVILATFLAMETLLVYRPTVTSALKGSRLAEALRIGSLLATALESGIINIVLFILAVNSYLDKRTRRAFPALSIFRRPPRSSDLPLSNVESFQGGIKVTVDLTVNGEKDTGIDF